MFIKRENNILPLHVNNFKDVFSLKLSFALIKCVPLLLTIIVFGAVISAQAQYIYQPNNIAQIQPNNNYLANSSTFKQEIARVEINVMRQGSVSLPITQVPRLEQNDVLKVRLSEDAINGVKPDQSNWDWTFLVAFINPGRNNEKEKLVSQEIQFRKTGWYKEYSFNVPYDSQPIFFLYTKPKYRGKILNLISENQEEIRKIGEKTIELSDAYAKIGSFLSELQNVIYRSQYYGMYGGYGNYNPYGGYGIYNNYGVNGTTGTTSTASVFNMNLFMEQSVERLARSFNVQLPGCWGGNNPFGGNNGIYNNYGNYGNNGIYNNGYNNYGYNNYGNNNFGTSSYGISNDFINRAQCVAKTVKLEDFDISVSRIIQQGGILAAAQLSQKYPQLAFWINIAAAAIDVILKITNKTPLKMVPTVISSSETSAQPGFQQNIGIQQNPNLQGNPMIPMSASVSTNRPNSVKISLFAESAPSESNFVTAYPLVVNKWQATPDPGTINLPTPILSDSCLHAGQNILQSTDLMNDWMADNFTKEFNLVISSSNGFRKEFPLKKNIGLNGWELHLTRDDLNAFPKVSIPLESVITGKRGFNEIKSEKFDLAIPNAGSWEMTASSQNEFTVGGKRIVTLKNQFGNCRCLQAVVYKPSFGGQFIFEANNKVNPLRFSEDGKEVFFEIDTTNFQPGQGQLELKQNSNEQISLTVNLHPAPPSIIDLKVSKGDNRVIVTGYRLEQIKSLKINGNKAIFDKDTSTNGNRKDALSVSNGTSTGSSSTATVDNPTFSQIGNNSVNSTGLPNSSPDSNKGLQAANQSIQSINPETQVSRPAIQSVDPSMQASYPPGYQNNQPNLLNGAQNSYLPNYSGNNTLNNQPTFNNSAVKITADIFSERSFIFEDPNITQDSKTITLELEIGESRTYLYPKIFDVSLARPAIVVNENREIEATALGSKIALLYNLGGFPVFPADTTEVSANVRNALTDYDFKIENIEIETRIENSQINFGELPKANFEVLDWKNMTITFSLNEQSQRLLSGRRLQFRIRDKVRGYSNWYTVENKFVRLPEISAVHCSNLLTENCLLKGKGIEYISQVSIDGGKTWFPEQPATIIAKPDINGEKTASIPHISGKKSLQIRLRDFSGNTAIAVNNYKILPIVKSKN